MEQPKATLDDLYKQNQAIIGNLERLHENLHYIREAAYGQTFEERERTQKEPPHGRYGIFENEGARLQHKLDEVLDALNSK